MNSSLYRNVNDINIDIDGNSLNLERIKLEI